ncbi:enterobactin synthetase component F [Thermoflexales bacterium]|nr:enterobactin synthetase component F [Thermoflexales bacterium]
MTKNFSSTANLTTQEQRARLLELLAKKESDVRLAPLSFSQERFWLEEQINPGSINGLSLTVRITGQLNVTALEQSFTEIVRRHEMLRTTFVLVNGQPMQSIKPAQPMQLPVSSLEHLPATMREAEARRIVRAELTQPFDIVHGPLLRTSLLQLDTTDHVLILITQHLVSDAWSLGNLIQELGVLYEAFSKDRPSPLPPLPLQYADFARWQREKMQEEVLEREIAYWVKQLSGSSGVLALPYDRPRPIKRTTLGAREPVKLPLLLREQLKALAQQEDCTLFMVLLAGLQILLHRYTGQANINLCTVVANRTINDVERLIGLFLNTLVLRADLEGNLTFTEVLQQARRTTLEAYDHQTIPFQKLLEALQAQLKFERASLFQVLLILQNVPNPDIKLSELNCQRFVREMDFQSDVELLLSLVETPEGLTGFLQYPTDLFDASTIQRLFGRYQILLQAVVDNPRQRIGVLPLLTEPERRQILTDWNNTDINYLQERCLHELFEDQVKRRPEAVAVVFEQHHLTYRELNQRANQLAHQLQLLGIGPDSLVGICLERSLEMILGVLGVLKAGGAYVPLDPQAPPERLVYMLADAGIAVLLTQQQLLDPLAEFSGQRICLDVDQEFDLGEHSQNPTSQATLDNLMYVIYTSGSTGNPKGVMVSHANVARLLAAAQAWYHFDEQDIWTLFHSYAFDFSIWELWGAWRYGGRVIIVPYWVSRMPETFYELLANEQVTILNQTPSAFSQLILAEERAATQHPLALRSVIFGGEALALQSLRPWYSRHPLQKPQLVNMYGITETTVHVTYRPVELDDLENVPGSMIGRPIPDLQVYILDRLLQLVPIGVPGEIYVGGAGLARGYLNRADLTAERFIPNPFGTRSGARLYKTGDLGRYNISGDIEYLGRSDFQVKVRGFRIELGEVETALRRHPAIRETVVLAREDRSGDKQLIAYIVLNDEAADGSGEMRSFLQGRLPPYMIPATFVKLDALPLTSNGKLDQRALPAPDLDTREKEYIPPETPVEKKLADIWAQVLQREKIGLYDNFLELGGHSLLATQVIFRVNQVFHLNLTLRSLFEEPTLAGLALLIEERVLEEIDSPTKRE